MSTDVKRMENLIEELNAATRAYDEGKPYMSDQEWDEKYFELLSLEKRFGVAYENSPTQTINFQVVSELKKIQHNHPMLSLAKTKSVEEVERFLGKRSYVAMCKMDGLTCSLRYYNGKLVSAETRGNGEVGEDILHNALVIPSIPKYISYKDELIVDGEIICCLDTFTNNFADTYRNARNFAAGSIRLLDSQECHSRDLTFVAWEVIKGFDEETELFWKLNQLAQLDFTVVPHFVNYFSTDKATISVEWDIDKLKEEAEMHADPIDGLVFKFNDIAYGQSLGSTGHHFKNAIAYKFYDETYETRIIDIEWTMGRTGILTPVAIFEPIDMDGSTVERASLHNLGILRQIFGVVGAFRGQKVEVFKANMIIPQIARAYMPDFKLDENSMIRNPKVCPICGGDVTYSRNDASEFLHCADPDCPGKLINRLDHFCGKKGLDIKGLSKATLDKLIEWDWVNNYTRLFFLHEFRADWMKKPGFGLRSVDKILASIKEASNCELHQFLCAIGIPLIGSTASKQLAQTFETYEKFREAIDNDFKFFTLPNFGVEMHNAIVKFDYREADGMVKENIITFKTPAIQEQSGTNLQGVTFVITGKVTKFKNRDELKAKIESLGGKVTGSVSKNTNFLINNDNKSTSAKNVGAQKLGVPIITEDEFIEKFL